ncbi:MAG: hypothetical protein H8E66_05920 [Planctomycetes bacterium]|nr:hypothetical protein [Planctomycetota bacterium]
MNDPNEWLKCLSQNHAVQTWLTFLPQSDNDVPNHQLAAFVGGGGDWRLVVSTGSSTEIWTARWEVTNQRAPDRRIWAGTYGCVEGSSEHSHTPRPDLDVAASRLVTALVATQEFAAQHQLDAWASRFQTAMDALDTLQPISFPDHIEFMCLNS